MKCYCGAANPNMDKVVKLLKTFETTAEATYKNAKKSTAKPPYKRPEDRDTKFKQLKDLLKDGTISLEVYINKILDIHKFEPKKKYVEELVDTDESDATSVDEDTDDEESEEEEEYESHHTDGEEDDEEIVTNEILSVANAIEEEVVQDEEVVVAVVVDDGKVACDICGKRYKVNGLNTHKAVHKKIIYKC